MREILGITPVPLYYISAIAGFVMVAGGMWLIYKEKIYIDRESKTVTEVETPFGKFKTNVPALVLFVLGFFPLIYPIVKSANPTAAEVQLEGEVKSKTYPVDVYAVIDFDSLRNQRSFNLNIPYFEGNSSYKYKVLYVVGPTVIQENLSLTGKKQKLSDIEFSNANITTFEPAASVTPRPAGF
jgi:hypothetical protein